MPGGRPGTPPDRLLVTVLQDLGVTPAQGLTGLNLTGEELAAVLGLRQSNPTRVNSQFYSGAITENKEANSWEKLDQARNAQNPADRRRYRTSRNHHSARWEGRKPPYSGDPPRRPCRLWAEDRIE